MFKGFLILLVFTIMVVSMKEMPSAKDISKAITPSCKDICK